MKSNTLKIIFISILLPLFISCADDAPTINAFPSSKESPVQDLGNLYPEIQSVSPGALQSVYPPETYPTDINKQASVWTVTFSHVMENNNNYMDQIFQLYEESTSIPFNTTPVHPVEDPAGTFVSSKTYIISPRVCSSFDGTIKNNTEYSLRIYKYAYINNQPSRHINFEKLVKPPARYLNPANPDFVEYRFRTAQELVPDTEPPVLFSSTPSDGDINVFPVTEYIELIFSDDSFPVIDPSSVNINSVILENITENIQLSIRIDLDPDDRDFTRFRITPLDPLLSSKQYRIRISNSKSIYDFSNNLMDQKDIYFDTIP